MLVWIFVFALRFFPLVTFPRLPAEVVGFLVVALATFGIAYTVARYEWRSRPRTTGLTGYSGTEIEALGLQQIIVTFVLVGAIGSALRGLDIFLLRGLDFSSGVSLARLENIAAVADDGAGGRLLSAFGRLLMGCVTVAFLAAFLRWERLPLQILVMAMASWVLTLFLSVLEGGRNTIVVNLVLLLAAGMVRRRCGRRFLPTGSFVRGWLKTIALLVTIYVLFVFTDRFAALGYKNEESVIRGIERAYSVNVEPWVIDLKPGALKEFAINGIMLVIYAAHGVDQMAGLMEWVSCNTLGFGRYNLDLVTVALGRAGLPIERFQFEDLPSPGLYVTALGELILDIGPTGTLVFLFALGLVLGRLWRVVPRLCPVAWELFLCFGLGWLIATPLYSLFSGFFGVVLATFAFHVAVLARKRLRLLP